MAFWPAHVTATSVPLMSTGTRFRDMGFVPRLLNAPRLVQAGVVTAAVVLGGVVVAGVVAVVYFGVRNGCLLFMRG